MSFPRYFKHTTPVTSDAVYIRHDDEHSDAVVVTTTGERKPNALQWPMVFTLLMVAAGLAVEITQAEANIALAFAKLEAKP